MKFGSFQSFKDRFLSRGGGRIDSFAMAAYGKLPIYKDYIIWECQQGGAAEFKLWLDEAFGMPWEAFDGKNARLNAPYRVLLLLPGGRHAVVASMWPSADEGDLRKFPFSLFTVFSRGDIIGRGLREAVEAVTPVWRAMEAQYRKIKQCQCIDDLYGYLQRSTPTVDVPEPSPDEELSVEDWLGWMYPGSVGNLRRWLDGELRTVIEAYRSFPEQGESLAARLPLARRLSTAPQVEIWDQLFRQNLKKMPVFPSVIIDCDPAEETGAVILVWRELRREDGRLFANHLADYEYVEMLAPLETPNRDGDDPSESRTEVERWIGSFGAS